MALDDAAILVPECPVCWTIDVEIVFWPSAWVKRSDGEWQRVMLKPGQQREIQCKCNSCGHEWEEYVKGV